ncbi:MAG: hypothetical protein ABEJ79_09235 [Halolamina sp.]
MSAPGGGSDHWDEVAAVVRQSRRRLKGFDPAVDSRTVACREGIAPIVELYVAVRRRGDSLSDVERSLLSGALNDWLDAYGRCVDRSPDGEFSLHEVALTYAREGSVVDTVVALVDDADSSTASQT